SRNDFSLRAPNLTTSPIHSRHQLRHTGCIGKIIFGEQQVTLLGDAYVPQTINPKTSRAK
ncbi:MAG: hypothetical protein ACK6DQ_10320, partial [Planctomycetota bacterium]